MRTKTGGYSSSDDEFVTPVVPAGPAPGSLPATEHAPGCEAWRGNGCTCGVPVTVDPATPTDERLADLSRDYRIYLGQSDPDPENVRQAMHRLAGSVPELTRALSSERAVSAGLRAEVERLREDYRKLFEMTIGHLSPPDADEIARISAEAHDTIESLASIPAKVERDRAIAERDAAQAQVQAVEAIPSVCGAVQATDRGLGFYEGWAAAIRDVRAALAAAQPTKETE